jgi:hypothetical protein
VKAGNMSLGDPQEKRPTDVLQRFVGIFEEKGWLNQTLRIKHRDRKYRICCTESEFLAYRINDHCSVLPGFPGWSVCIVTHDQIVEDSDMSAFSSSEPSTHEWLRCIAEGDFELI